MNSDTIVAISTAVSHGGISIIRMSGKDSFSIIDKIYKAKKQKKKLSEANSHTIHYGYIQENNIIIDEVLVSIMRAPNTYTKEDIIEINCHGGILVTKKILELVVNCGARPAEPGEFTKRAFLNGRIDLSQAEAVMDVINAKNEYALRSSINQLRGSVKVKIEDIRRDIIHKIAFIEAALDDPEHIQLDGFKQELKERVEHILFELKNILKSSEDGKFLTEGIKTVIVGKPNAGKSSLLNVLIGEERAIVTDIEGTTRDTLEETIQLGGISLNIVDTAGIRNTTDLVEQIGVDRAKKNIEVADLIIFVIDASKELDQNDDIIMDLVKYKNTIIILNKTDLNMVLTKNILQEKFQKEVVEVSAKKEIGFDQLEKLIQKMFFQGKIHYNDELYITNIRHKTLMKEAIQSLEQVLISIENQMPEDFYSIDLMNAYSVLGSIIGESVGEDLVDTIFSEFCMGK